MIWFMCPSLSRFLHLARGKFLQPRLALAALQFGQHVGRLQAELRQREHRVEPQVGHLVRRSSARSPSLPAITTSVASSPIFFRIASLPLENRRAT